MLYTLMIVHIMLNTWTGKESIEFDTTDSRYEHITKDKCEAAKTEMSKLTQLKFICLEEQPQK